MSEYCDYSISKIFFISRTGGQYCHSSVYGQRVKLISPQNIKFAVIGTPLPLRASGNPAQIDANILRGRTTRASVDEYEVSVKRFVLKMERFQNRHFSHN